MTWNKAIFRTLCTAASLGLGLSACEGVHDAPRAIEEPVGDVPECNGPHDPTAPKSFTAAAPLGIGEQHLGQPVDANFEFYPGERGRTLFPKAETFRNEINAMEHRSMAFEDSRSLAANVSGLQLGPVTVGGSVGNARSRRFAAYQAQQINYAAEVDSTATMHRPPDGASYFVSRIFYGYGYNVTLQGSDSNFHAAVKVGFLKWGGSLAVFAENHSLQINARGQGLKPKNGDAVFARTEDEIRGNYEQASSPTPILVEYKAIPRACIAPAQLISWNEPGTVTVKLDKLRVYDRKKKFWSLDFRCRKAGKSNDELIANPQPLLNTEVRDNCQEDSIPSPGGEDDFCEINLGYEVSLSMADDEEITCYISGQAANGGNPVPVGISELNFSMQDLNNSTDGSISDWTGTYNGQTSYLVNWLATK